jgi:hypothetical protein
VISRLSTADETETTLGSQDAVRQAMSRRDHEPPGRPDGVLGLE